MTSFEQDQLRARTDTLQVQADTMLNTYEQQLRDIASARDVLAAATATGWSDDNLVKVTTNSAGVPVEVWIDPAAYKRAVPEKLAASFLQATQAAARAARAELDSVLAPITAAAAEFGPPADPFTGLPSFEQPTGDFLPSPPAAEQAPPPAPEPQVDDEDEDDGPHWKGFGESKNGW